MTSKAQQLLLVLGMHRSGTSALSRGARVFGANLGDRFLDSREDNPKGFWEDADLLRLQTEMFEALGMAWDRLTPVTVEEVRSLEAKGFRSRARQLVASKLTGPGLHAFKHPGMAKLFPFWREVFSEAGYEVLVLLAVRHPLSVARSLARRDGMGQDYACLLWLAHVLPSLPLPPVGPAVVVDYDRLMESPEREIRRVAESLSLTVDAGELAEYRDNFLDSQLRHTSFTVCELEEARAVHPLVGRVYRGLLEFAADRRSLRDPAATALFAEWHQEFAAMTPLLRMIEQTTAERDRQAILLENATRELAWRDASVSWRLTRPLREICTLGRKFSDRARG